MQVWRAKISITQTDRLHYPIKHKKQGQMKYIVYLQEDIGLHFRFLFFRKALDQIFDANYQ